MLLERRWYWAAGLVGALATAGRPVGIAVAIGLVVRTVELIAIDRARARRADEIAADPDADVPDDATSHRSWRELRDAIRSVRWRHAGVLLSGAGIGGWCLYLWLAFGNPIAFVDVESAPGWDQGVGPHTWFKITFFGTLIKGPYSIGALLIVQAVACLCAVLLLRRTWRLFGWGYTAYAAVVLLIPIIGTKDFMGTGRYVLAAFPVLAAAGHYLATRRQWWVRPLVLITCATLLVALTTLYGRSVEVS